MPSLLKHGHNEKTHFSRGEKRTFKGSQWPPMNVYFLALWINCRQLAWLARGLGILDVLAFLVILGVLAF